MDCLLEWRWLLCLLFLLIQGNVTDTVIMCLTYIAVNL